MKTCEKWIACGLAVGFLALLFLVLQNPEIPFDPFLQCAILGFRAPMMTRAMTLLTYTANWQFITGICLILLILPWTRRFPGLILSASPLFSTLLYKLIKEILQRPRPEEALHLIQQGGFSFPSGHAMTGLVFYGLVLYFLLNSIKNSRTRRVLLAVGVVYIFFIGFSRIYLGVHYPSDVMAGWCLGGLQLMLILRLPVGSPGQRKYSLYRWTEEFRSRR
jgi:undecaprenyl-diphosphatase